MRRGRAEEPIALVPFTFAGRVSFVPTIISVGLVTAATAAAFSLGRY